MDSNVSVRSRMTPYPIVADAKMPIEDALLLMNQFGIRHLPVAEERQVVGAVSERDILRAGAGSGAKLAVADVMKKDVFVAAPGTPLAEVTRVMCREKLGSAVVVDPQCNVMGIFTTTDALRLLTELLSSPDKRAGPDLEISVAEFFDWDPALGETYLGSPDCVAFNGIVAS